MTVGDVARGKRRGGKPDRQVAQDRGQPQTSSQPAGDGGDQENKTDFEDGGGSCLHSSLPAAELNKIPDGQRPGRAGSRLGPTCASSQPVSGLLSLIAPRMRSFVSAVCSPGPGFQLRLAISPLHRSSSARG